MDSAIRGDWLCDCMRSPPVCDYIRMDMGMDMETDNMHAYMVYTCTCVSASVCVSSLWPSARSCAAAFHSQQPLPPTTSALSTLSTHRPLAPSTPRPLLLLLLRFLPQVRARCSRVSQARRAMTAWRGQGPRWHLLRRMLLPPHRSTMYPHPPRTPPPSPPPPPLLPPTAAHGAYSKRALLAASPNRNLTPCVLSVLSTYS